MACRADKPDCIKALLLAGADVNKEAGTGDINYSEPGYVGNFLQDNPNTLYHEDMKNGGTPLHWAKSRQGMEGLLEANCNINALNFQKKTALHVMVERERWVGFRREKRGYCTVLVFRLDCVVCLLSRQANVDPPDQNGNHPIHLAVKRGNLPILQALIVFGASLDVLNNEGESPRHLVTKGS